MAYTLGLGLTNECNLACAHCYRPTDGTFRLSLRDVRRNAGTRPLPRCQRGSLLQTRRTGRPLVGTLPRQEPLRALDARMAPALKTRAWAGAGPSQSLHQVI